MEKGWEKGWKRGRKRENANPTPFMRRRENRSLSSEASTELKGDQVGRMEPLETLSRLEQTLGLGQWDGNRDTGNGI